VRITRLYLRNYRVYEDELDLELPPGLVGIYGPNGSGKSVLIESILFGLWGHSRTTKEEVRTADVGGDCVTEVEFEHEGHLYVVRRTLSGINATVTAQVEVDGAQVAEGAQAVRQYVHSVLGMDAAAFRASVFAEQKQLAAFSEQRPAERRDLVLRLLGVTPLDRARDDARRDARAESEAFERLRGHLPDLEALKAEAADADAAAGAREAEARSEEAGAVTAKQRLAAADELLDQLEALRREHEALVAEGKAVRIEHQRAGEEAEGLAAELAQLDDQALRLPALEADAAGLDEVEARLRLVEAITAAEARLETVPVVDEPAGVDDEACEAASAEAAAAEAQLAEVSGRLLGALQAEARARDAVDRSGPLSGEGACPLCGQRLGEAFEQVRSHRAAELEEAGAAVRALIRRRDQLSDAARQRRAAAEEAVAATKQARQAWSLYERHRAQRHAAEQAAAEARSRLGRPVGPGEQETLGAELRRRQAAARERDRVVVRLERRGGVEADLLAARSRAAHAADRLEILREKLGSLGYRADDHQVARESRQQAAAAAERAAEAARDAQLEAARTRERATAAADLLARGREQHAAVETQADQARHLGRLAQLLNDFRNTVVATVGPRLSGQAADLFAELTDHEYDRLEVDPETYEIKIRDRGRLYGMDRFSGSEIDLANLALRVAISEHVRLLSGGAVGLLVLDEVFGPLDDDRKARMLAAFERLRSRFRQVLVVTHDDSVKAELPHAVEVVKRPGRRATARLVTV
jgi:exonuclease SbcC